MTRPNADNSRLRQELNEALGEGLKISPRCIATLWIIAHLAHHEDDPAHKDGLRKAGKTYLEPRCAWITNEYLALRLGKTSNSSRKAALQELEALGLRVRVPYGTDKNGNPVYGTGGRAPIYRLPTVEEFREAARKQREERGGLKDNGNDN